jgi:hypothetical protein
LISFRGLAIALVHKALFIIKFQYILLKTNPYFVIIQNRGLFLLSPTVETVGYTTTKHLQSDSITAQGFNLGIRTPLRIVLPPTVETVGYTITYRLQSASIIAKGFNLGTRAALRFLLSPTIETVDYAQHNIYNRLQYITRFQPWDTHSFEVSIASNG